MGRRLRHTALAFDHCNPILSTCTESNSRSCLKLGSSTFPLAVQEPSLFSFPLYSEYSDTFVAEMAGANRWLRPEVYPLFAAVGVAVAICGIQLIRNICINPEVRVKKENRSAGVLDNFAEGEKYADHSLRKYLRNKSPEIMPSINSFFADPANRN